jgi:hypothetical protein
MIIIKAKTVGDNIKLQDIIDLWIGKPVKVKKDYWVRDIKEGSVTIVKRDIKLLPNLDKRDKVFNDEGFWIDTKPLVVKEP